jgi:hypothetical protein
LLKGLGVGLLICLFNHAERTANQARTVERADQLIQPKSDPASSIKNYR